MGLGDLVHYRAAAHLCKEKLKQVEERRLEVRRSNNLGSCLCLNLGLRWWWVVIILNVIIVILAKIVVLVLPIVVVMLIAIISPNCGYMLICFSPVDVTYLASFEFHITLSFIH